MTRASDSHLSASGHDQPPPITIRRNRVPRITLIKRAAEPAARPDAVVYFGAACAAVFVVLLGVALVVWLR